MDRPVVAVEPAPAMLAVAAAKRLPRVVLVRGRAEQLPLRAASCGAAWLSTVVHHLDDLAGAARESRRVVAGGGAVLVRSSFPDQVSGDVLPTRFFPSAGVVRRRVPHAGPDDEFEDGLAAARRWAAEQPGEPVRYSPELLVFR